MPGGDGTGPRGMGPMTGRAAGYCAGYPMPGFANPIPGRGWARYGGRGRGVWGPGRGLGGRRGMAGIGYPPFGGWAYPFPAELAPREEVGALTQEAEALKAQLADIESRLETLSKAEGAKPEA